MLCQGPEVSRLWVQLVDIAGDLRQQLLLLGLWHAPKPDGYRRRERAGCISAFIPVYTYIYILVRIYIYTHHNFFILSSIRGYLGSLHVLAIINHAAMNMGGVASELG